MQKYEKDIRERVALNVQNLRRQKGLSQEELAFEAKLHRTYISGIESCTRNPTIMVLARLARALNVDPAQLLEKR